MSDQAVFVPGRLPSWGVEAMRKFFELMFFLVARVHVHGIENIPAAGGFIVATNHLSAFDVPLGFIVMKNHRVVGFAGDTWRKYLVTRAILEMVDVIWVPRGKPSPSSIKTAIRVLHEGYVLGVAPEGTRSQDSHALLKGKTGAAFLAIMSDVPILPLAITNTENLWNSIKHLRRIDIGVAIGKPFTLSHEHRGTHTDSEELEKATDEIMCRIAALLPPIYRGEYAAHPRLKELLSSDMLVQKTPTRIE